MNRISFRLGSADLVIRLSDQETNAERSGPPPSDKGTRVDRPLASAVYLDWAQIPEILDENSPATTR
jgi:hypothetical protein